MKHFITNFFSRMALVTIVATVFTGTAMADQATFNFGSLASSNNWSNGTAYTSVVISPITLSAAGGGNNGKYYVSDNTWRMYNGGTVNISAADGYSITAVSSTPSQTFTVSNGAASLSCSATIKFTSITVTYQSNGGGQPTTYTVNYDANGGTGTMTDSNSPYNAGATVTVKNNSFTRTDYTFSNWNTAADGSGTAYDEGDTFTINANTTLYAQWSQSGSGNTLVFDFEDNSAHRTSGSNSYASNSYSENGVDISLTYADAVTSGTPLSGIANVMGRIARNTTNRPVVLIGPIDISLWTVTKIEYNTLGVGAMAQLFETSLDGTNWTSQKNISSMPTSNTKETVDNLSITGSELYLRWVVSVSSSTGSNRDFQLDDIVITYEESSTPIPSISAENVDIAYGATSGNITFTLNNGVQGGVISAAITSGNEGNWLSLGNQTTSPISFTCTANEASSARSATVTLTYTYNTNETVTKAVTITQAAAPVIYTTIPTLFNAASSTSTSVNITFGSWVISAVKGNNAYLTDNQGNGLIIYQNEHGFAVNDVLTGTVTCNLVLYQGSAELTGLTRSTQGLTVTSNGSVTEQTIAISELGGVNTGALVAFEGLTYNGSALVDGNSNTITPYTSLYNFESTFVDGISYDVKGIYLQFNTTKEILPRSSADIEEVQSQSPVIVADDVELEYNATSGEIAYTVHNPTSGSVSATTSAAWISNVTVTAEKVTFTTTANETNADRTATFTLTYPGAENKPVTVTQKHFVADYATLPFSFDGGRGDIANTAGLTQEGLDSDYGSSPKLKFNSADDWVILKFNEAPGTLSFDVKGNPGGNPAIWAGTFKVQTSSDGETFTDLKTYDDLTLTVLSESFSNLDQNVRYIKWVYASKTSGNVALGNILLSRDPSVAESITVTPVLVNALASDEGGELAIDYRNIAISDATDFGVQFCDENGDELASGSEPDWIDAEVEISGSDYVVVYVMDTNEGDAARMAYLKVFAMGTEDFVYSNLVTITQAAHVVDYAELPFIFEDGRNEIENTVGLTQDGLDSDYSEPPYLKFKTQGTWVVLKFNERPGTLTYDIKGNSFSGGTFKVQTSVDGTNYTDLKSYTSLGGTTQSEEFSNLGENVRYVRWIYTTKSNGNVALGNIALAAYSSVPSITVTPDSVNAAASDEGGELAIDYRNIAISDATDFGVQFCDENGDELASGSEPDWIDAGVEISGSDYVVVYVMDSNEGDAARTAYLKVFAMGTEDFVYSNLVTITQAAPVAPVSGDEYTLYTGALVEGDYIIYYNGSAMKNTVDGGRLYYEEVTPVNDVIATADASIVWHIAPSDDYWTIYSPDLDEFAAGTGVKNKAQMLADGSDDKSLWTVSGTETYEFVNKANAAANVNANLRNNADVNDNYGFACYATTTGGALSLYKRSDAPATITLTGTLDNGRYWTTFYNSAERYTLPDGAMAFTMNSDYELYRLGSDGKEIPANTAVVIMSDAQSITLTKSNSTSAVAINGGANILRGSNYSIEAANLSGTPHVMGKVNNALGYYEYSGASIPAMKAYYKVNE